MKVFPAKPGLLSLLIFAVLVTARLDGAMITIDFATATGADGIFVYLSDPNGTQPAHDDFFANIVSPQYGNGTLSVPSDFTNYITGVSHADLATFVFAAGTFAGSADAVLNFAAGVEEVTYQITSGTGVFSGATGTLRESAQFTSFGSFSPNLPATVKITSGGGNLTVVPEPGTFALTAPGLCLLYGACLRRLLRRD